MRHLSAIALMAAILSAGPALAEVPEGAVAVVNGTPVLRADFAGALVRTLGRATLDRYLDRLLIQTEARRKGLTVTEEELQERKQLEVELRMLKVFSNARTTPEEFRRLADNYGWDEAAYRREVEQSISLPALRIRLLAEKLLRPYVEITSEHVRDYYHRTLGERYSAAHVEVADEATARQLMAQMAQQTLSWQEAVMRHSLDRASVPHKGRMQPVPASGGIGLRLKDATPDQLRLYDDGTHSHILRLVGRTAASVVPFDEVRDRLKSELYCCRVDGLIDGFLAQQYAAASIVTNVSADPKVRAILGSEVVAFINGEPIAMSAFGETLLQEFGAGLIGPYIERELIFQQTSALELEVSEAAVRKRMASMGDRLFAERAAEEGVSPRRFAAVLKDRGVSPVEFRRRLVQDLVTTESVRAVLLAEQAVSDGVEVTDIDIRQAYKEHYGQRVDARHIVVDSAVLAGQVLQQAQEGVSFDLLVQTMSRESLAWVDGGLIGDMTPKHPYFQHVEQLEVGELSKVFQDEAGHHLLKVVARRTVDQPPPLQDVHDELRERLTRERLAGRVKAWIEKLKAESDTETSLQ